MGEHKKGVLMDRAIARRLAYWSEASTSTSCPTPEEEGMLYIAIDGMDQDRLHFLRRACREIINPDLQRPSSDAPATCG